MSEMVEDYTSNLLYKVYKESLFSETKQFKVSLLAFDKVNNSLLTFKDIPFTVIWQDEIHYAKFKVLDENWLLENPDFVKINELELSGLEFDGRPKNDEDFTFYWGTSLETAFNLLIEVEREKISDKNSVEEIKKHISLINKACDLKLNDFKVIKRNINFNLEEVQNLSEKSLERIKKEQKIYFSNFIENEIVKAAEKGLYEVFISRNDFSKFVKFEEIVIDSSLEELKEKGFHVIPCRQDFVGLTGYNISWNRKGEKEND